jgi:hypothetical protein
MSNVMQTLVTDLVVTDAFLIKGVVGPKPRRLSTLLDESRNHFLSIRDATLVDLRDRNTIRTPRILVNLDRVVLAHEFVDAAGDNYLRSLSHDRELVTIRAFHVGAVNFEIAGQVRRASYEANDANRRFFVVERPTFRGIEFRSDNDELSVLKRLDYVIVAKQRLSYIYDFNE